MFECIERVFSGYEEVMRQEMEKDERVLSERLEEYQSRVNAIVESCRIISHKFSNKSTMMEGLIGFYSKHDLTTLFKDCEDKLQEVQFRKLEMIGNNE